MAEMTKEWAIEKVDGYGLSSDYVDVIYLATILLKHERRGVEIDKLNTEIHDLLDEAIAYGEYVLPMEWMVKLAKLTSYELPEE